MNKYKQAAANYSVLTPWEFLADIQQEADNAKSRVWMQAMYVEGGTILSAISTILSTAAKRGTDSRLHADWFSLKYADDKYIKPKSEGFTRKMSLFDDLKSTGVNILFTNPPTPFEHLFPYKGRNHMKMTVIDSVAYLGGVNFADPDFDFIDFMIKFTDPDIVEAIASLFIAVETDTVHDAVIPINKHSRLLVDSGKIGKSVILKSAIEMTTGVSKSIVHTCQLFPDGKFLTNLRRAFVNGARVDVICPAKHAFSPQMATAYALNRMSIKLRNKSVPVHLVRGMVHAKLTIVDGNSIMIGSHNLTRNGVLMGTGEVALQSTQPELVHNLQQYFETLFNTTQAQ